MKRCLQFWIIGAPLAALPFLEGGLSWLLVWPAMNFLVIGIAYARGNPHIFGKRPDGTLSPFRAIVFLPYLLLTSLLWHVIRLTTKEPAVSRITENISTGRRLLPGELPPDVTAVADLTCEFHEPAGVRARANYIPFPILDASAPSPERLCEFTASLPSEGHLFIHCAQGHGRTGLVALALLLHRGIVPTVSEGLKLLQASRPGIGLSREQTNCLKAAFPEAAA